MTAGMGLPSAPYTSLVGFRPDGCTPGAKIEIQLSAEAFAQLLEHGATGAVASVNLVLTDGTPRSGTVSDTWTSRRSCSAAANRPISGSLRSRLEIHSHRHDSAVNGVSARFTQVGPDGAFTGADAVAA